MRHVRIEGALRAGAWMELEGYRVADIATDALLWALNNATIEGGDGDPPPEYLRQRALLYLGVMTLRESRAILALLASGYEAEAVTHMRTLIEASSRAQSVEDDPSGSYAEAWLLGRAGKPSAAFAKVDANDLWKLMSHQSHADHRAVENWYAVSHDDGTSGLLVMPERRPEVSNASASMAAGYCRDMARRLSTAFGFEIPDLHVLDEALKQLPLWSEEPEGGDEAPPNVS